MMRQVAGLVDTAEKQHGKRDLRVGMITATRDEERDLPRLLLSVATQTRRPHRWVIVDTGSTDDTLRIVQSFAAAHPWVTVEVMDGPIKPTRGAIEVDALMRGIGALGAGYDVIVKVDADVSFATQHLEVLVGAFERSPELGMASGTRVEWHRGRWRTQGSTATSVEAQARAYRWACLQDVLPLERRMGWDVIDESIAVASGWQTERLNHTEFMHHRPMGSRDQGSLTHWAKQGEVAHYTGYRPTYLFARTMRRACTDPRAVAMLLTYASLHLRRADMCSNLEALAVRRDQQRLRHLPQRAKETYPGPGRRGTSGRPLVDLLLVSGGGGHLFELHALRNAFANFSQLWITEDQIGTRALLAAEPRVLRPERGRTRRLLLLRELMPAARVALRHRPRVVITTGSALSVPYVWAARAVGARVVYIECAGRVRGRSLGLRLLAPIATRLYVQWPEQAKELSRGQYAGTAGLAAALKRDKPTACLSAAEVVVLLGTFPRPFPRLLDMVETCIGGRTVIVQAGVTPYRRSELLVVDYLAEDALAQLIRGAKTVITHAGIGSVCTCLANGKVPIVVPREARLFEHVDDHQIPFANQIGSLGLAIVATNPDELSVALRREQAPRISFGEVRDLSHELTDYLGSVVLPRPDGRRNGRTQRS
jgi:UDP-N-acetylglucosamine transferase subunit ALG13